MDKSISMKLFIVMICITAFFFNSIGNGYYMLILCMLPVCFKIINLMKRMEIHFSTLSLILFIMFACISSILSPLKTDSNKFVFMLIMFLFVKIILEDSFGWQNVFSSILFFITLLSVCATMLSVIAPELMIDIAKVLFDGETYDVYMNLFYSESYAGIYGHTGINAYVISMFLAFVVTELFSEKSVKLNYILLGIGIIALLLTRKRSFILSNIIASFVLFMQSNKSQKNTLKKIFRILFLILTVYLIIRYTSATNGIIKKNLLLENAGDISNGRIASWKDTFNIWKKNPVFGVGTNTMVGKYDLSTHNVYIQILAEMGLIGVFSYIFLLWSSFRRSKITYQYILNDYILTTKKKLIYGVSLYMQMIFIVYSFFGNPVYGINFMLPYIIFVSVIDSYQKYRRSVIK